MADFLQEIGNRLGVPQEVALTDLPDWKKWQIPETPKGLDGSKNETNAAIQLLARNAVNTLEMQVNTGSLEKRAMKPNQGYNDIVVIYESKDKKAATAVAKATVRLGSNGEVKKVSVRTREKDVTRFWEISPSAYGTKLAMVVKEQRLGRAVQTTKRYDGSRDGQMLAEEIVLAELKPDKGRSPHKFLQATRQIGANGELLNGVMRVQIGDELQSPPGEMGDLHEGLPTTHVQTVVDNLRGQETVRKVGEISVLPPEADAITYLRGLNEYRCVGGEGDAKIVKWQGVALPRIIQSSDLGFNVRPADAPYQTAAENDTGNRDLGTVQMNMGLGNLRPSSIPTNILR